MNTYSLWNCGKLICMSHGTSKVDAIKNGRAEHPILMNVSLMAKLVEDTKK